MNVNCLLWIWPNVRTPGLARVRADGDWSTVDGKPIVVSFLKGRLTKLEIAHPYCSNLFAGFYSKDIIAEMSKERCTWLFITTLFRRVKS